MVRKVEGRIIGLAVIGLLMLSCNEVQEHTAPAVHDRDSASVMISYGVNTLISDSGVIKYKIVTERWEVNTVKNPTFWKFDKGVFFEQFDEKFHVEAYIQADSAWYYDQKKLWHLRGRVRIRNVNGLLFQSEELFWDGVTHEIYSNVYSKVTTPERSMEGTYFLSDEHMSHYTVSNSKGSFTREDMTGEQTGDDAGKTPGSQPDTVQVQQPMRQQVQKHRRTGQ